MTHRFDQVFFDTKKKQLADVKAAITDLNTIASTIGSANQAKANTAIKSLAEYQTIIIKSIVRESIA